MWEEDERKIGGQQGKLISVNGERHPISVWARLRAMRADTIKARLRRGWSERDAIFTPRCRAGNPIRVDTNISWRGRSQSIYMWARELGFSTTTLQGRIRHGWSVEDALTTPAGASKRTGKTDLTFNGETHSVYGWSKKTGLSNPCIRLRLKECWSVEEALTVPRYGKRKNAGISSLTFDGRTRTIHEWAHVLGLKSCSLRRRLNSWWSVEEALTVHKGNYRGLKELTLNGETHSIAEWGRRQGLGKSAIYHRLSRGWSIEEVLTRSIRGKRREK